MSEREREIVLVHTSDVHVDDSYTARLFGGDGVAPLRLVLNAARAHGADLALLVGDTFECHRLPDALIEASAREIAAFGAPVALLPGNHDPAVADAVFHHPALRALDNLIIFGVTHGETAALPHLDLELWGRAHADYYDMDPLAAPPPRAGARWRVALAHGHYTPEPDRSTRARPSWLFGDAEIAALEADYLALGHWNRAIRVGDEGTQAHYSGSPDYARSVNVVRLGPAGVRVERADLPGL